jgi:hypothetical protein
VTDPNAAAATAAPLTSPSADVSARLAHAAADVSQIVAGTDPAITASWISGALTALGTVLAVIFAASYAYRHAREHSRREHETAIRVDRLRREIDALERAWGLLAYMTFAENDAAVVRYREDQHKHKTFYLNLDNLRRFIRSEMRNAFYTEHAGLHLPNDIRDELFEYQGSLIGLYIKYENEPAGDARMIELKSQRLVDKLRDHYHKLNTMLRAALEQRYVEMRRID